MCVYVCGRDSLKSGPGWRRRYDLQKLALDGCELRWRRDRARRMSWFSDGDSGSGVGRVGLNWDGLVER